MFQQLDGNLVYMIIESDQIPAPDSQPIAPVLGAAHRMIETEAVLELCFMKSSNIR